MSKMSNIALELDEHAVELGFTDHLEALANGYGWRIDENKIARLFKLKDPQDEAHEAWLKERDDILDDLEHLKNIYKEVKPDEDIVERTINFIKEQCHD